MTLFISRLTCPHCGHRETEPMPTDAARCWDLAYPYADPPMPIPYAEPRHRAHFLDGLRKAGLQYEAAGPLRSPQDLLRHRLPRSPTSDIGYQRSQRPLRPECGHHDLGQSTSADDPWRTLAGVSHLGSLLSVIINHHRRLEILELRRTAENFPDPALKRFAMALFGSVQAIPKVYSATPARFGVVEEAFVDEMGDRSPLRRALLVQSDDRFAI